MDSSKISTYTLIKRIKTYTIPGVWWYLSVFGGVSSQRKHLQYQSDYCRFISLSRYRTLIHIATRCLSRRPSLIRWTVRWFTWRNFKEAHSSFYGLAVKSFAKVFMFFFHSYFATVFFWLKSFFQFRFLNLMQHTVLYFPIFWQVLE